jgi:hypothetical protein
MIIDAKQWLAQDALREALNQWLDDRGARDAVLAAIAAGGRLDAPARMGRASSVVADCAGIVFDAAGWEDIASFCARAPNPACVPGPDGSYPMHAAAACANLAAIRALGAMGASWDPRDAGGLAPIHRLCAVESPCESSKYPASLAEFAARGCALSPSPAGDPLLLATQAGFASAIGALARAGADLGARAPRSNARLVDIACAGKSEATAIAFAREGGPLEADFDSNAPACPSPLAASLAKGWPQAAKAFLVAGSSLAAPSGRDGHAPLPSLAEMGPQAAGPAARPILQAFLAMDVAEEGAAKLFDAAPERARRVAARVASRMRR